MLAAMRFGLALPQYGFSLPTGRIGYDDTVDWARRAEDLGFDSVWLSDHFFYSFTRYGADPAPIEALEPLTALPRSLAGAGPSSALGRRQGRTPPAAARGSLRCRLERRVADVARGACRAGRGRCGRVRPRGPRPGHVPQDGGAVRHGRAHRGRCAGAPRARPRIVPRPGDARRDLGHVAGGHAQWVAGA